MQTDAMRELHIFQYEPSKFIIFHPITRVFFRANSPTARILQAYTQGFSLEHIASAEHAPKDQISELIAYLEMTIRRRWETFSAPSPECGKKICGKLTLHVSNDCNMRCTYCYAQAGTYGMRRELMGSDLALRCVNRFYEHYDQVRSIMFFGGEPLLNLATIRAVCEHLTQMVQQRPAIRLPRFGMITNLSFIPSGLCELINMFKIGVTASLDGPQAVNDANRYFRGGRGTFSKVAENIRRLTSATGQPTMIEATFTRQHIEQGFSPSVLAQYFAEAFHIYKAQVSLACVPKGHPSEITAAQTRQLREDQEKATATSILKLKTSNQAPTLSRFHQRLRLLCRESAAFDFHCVAGVTQYAVDANGDVYPCHMFVGIPEFRMGNIQDSGVFDSSRFHTVSEGFVDNRKSSTEVCRNCWARNLCVGCPGTAYRELRTIRVSTTVDCVQFRRSIEHLLSHLAMLNADPAAWHNFLANTNSLCEQRLGPMELAMDRTGNRR